MLNSTQKNIDQICIIGGSGKIGNKVMSILMHKEIKVSLLLSRHTVDELNKTNGNEYRKSLNDKISKYNETKQESEQKIQRKFLHPSSNMWLSKILLN